MKAINDSLGDNSKFIENSRNALVGIQGDVGNLTNDILAGKVTEKDISDKEETNVCKAINEMIEKGVQRGIVQGKEAGKIEAIMQIKLNIPRIQLRVLTSAVVLCYNFIHIGKFCFVWNMPDLHIQLRFCCVFLL